MPLTAETIYWQSDAEKTNLDSAGVVMDAGFQFELGVFTGGFSPTAGNTSDWQAHWQAADSTGYNVTNKRFSASFAVTGNTAPFTVGAAAWIFGRRETSTGSDWILFRKATWLWPAPNPMNPFGVEWNAKNADIVVLGSVNASESPYLMKSAGFQTFAQWQTEHLTGELLDAPNDDPDQDGTPNILEFVFGTPPKSAGAPVLTPVVLVGGHLQITIPRRLDHPANLTVEVSGDLANWSSGPFSTGIVSDDVSALVVRDLTALDAAHPRRFIRLRAVLP
jgi:hypothetical protein